MLKRTFRRVGARGGLSLDADSVFGGFFPLRMHVFGLSHESLSDLMHRVFVSAPQRSINPIRDDRILGAKVKELVLDRNACSQRADAARYKRSTPNVR